MRNTLILIATLLPTTLITGTITQCINTVPRTVQNVNKPDVHCLSVLIYGEARGESLLGKIAVAYTVINRAKNKTLCQVALAPKQYSIFNNNPELRAAAVSLHLEPKQKNKLDNKSWAQSLAVAELVMKRAVKDPVSGATHYLSDSLMKSRGYHYPRWSKEYVQVGLIGKHRFFKKKPKS